MLQECGKFVLITLIICTVSTGCPAGWHQSFIDATKCYLVAQKPMSWQDAEDYCRNSAPSHVISVLSAFETNELNSIASTNPAIGSLDQVWIGAKGVNGDEIFSWSDGSPFVYTNWLAEQPNLLYPCVSSQARSTGRWRTEPCDTQNYFICKYTMQHTPTPSDYYDLYYQNGNFTSGIYQIYPPGIASFSVQCDMTTDGGRWTVFQKRTDDSAVFWMESPMG